MTNFKSGSGNLDFGDGEESAEADRSEPSSASTPPSRDDTEPASPESSTTDSPAAEPTADSHPPAGQSRGTYPYFVRRSNVGDERDTRLEIHVRDKVADQEAQFRRALAERLDASDVSKTDAREFALLAAFEHPEKVAQLMREEGFDTLG